MKIEFAKQLPKVSAATPLSPLEAGILATIAKVFGRPRADLERLVEEETVPRPTMADGSQVARFRVVAARGESPGAIELTFDKAGALAALHIVALGKNPTSSRVSVSLELVHRSDKPASADGADRVQAVTDAAIFEIKPREVQAARPQDADAHRAASTFGGKPSGRANVLGFLFREWGRHGDAGGNAAQRAPQQEAAAVRPPAASKLAIPFEQALQDARAARGPYQHQTRGADVDIALTSLRAANAKTSDKAFAVLSVLEAQEGNYSWARDVSPAAVASLVRFIDEAQANSTDSTSAAISARLGAVLAAMKLPPHDRGSLVLTGLTQLMDTTEAISLQRSVFGQDIQSARVHRAVVPLGEGRFGVAVDRLNSNQIWFAPLERRMAVLDGDGALTEVRAPGAELAVGAAIELVRAHPQTCPRAFPDLPALMLTEAPTSPFEHLQWPEPDEGQLLSDGTVLFDVMDPDRRGHTKTLRVSAAGEVLDVGGDGKVAGAAGGAAGPQGGLEGRLKYLLRAGIDTVHEDKLLAALDPSRDLADLHVAIHSLVDARLLTWPQRLRLALAMGDEHAARTGEPASAVYQTLCQVAEEPRWRFHPATDADTGARVLISMLRDRVGPARLEKTLQSLEGNESFGPKDVQWQPLRAKADVAVEHARRFKLQDQVRREPITAEDVERTSGALSLPSSAAERAAAVVAFLEMYRAPLPPKKPITPGAVERLLALATDALSEVPPIEREGLGQRLSELEKHQADVRGAKL